MNTYLIVATNSRSYLDLKKSANKNSIIIYGSMEREHYNTLLNIYKNLNKK